MLSERLKEARKLRNLSQKEVAIKLNISRSTYAGYETNRSNPDPDTLKKLVSIFNLSADYLLGLIDVQLSPDEVKFMKMIHEVDNPEKIAEEFNIYGDDLDKPVTMGELKQIIEDLKKVDKDAGGIFSKKKS